MKLHTAKGFTLIELLMVVAIISLLSSVVLASLNTARSKARDTKRLTEIRQLMTALELYRDANGNYPISNTGCGATSPNGPNPAWCNSVESLAGGHWIRHNNTPNVLAPYMNIEPTDPQQGGTPIWSPVSGGTYFYYATPTSNPWYMIVFGLENFNAQLEAQDGVACPFGAVPFDYANALVWGVGC